MQTMPSIVVDAGYLRARPVTGSQNTKFELLGSTAWILCELRRPLRVSVHAHGGGGHSSISLCS